VHARGKPLATDVNLDALAKTTIGFSGADLENVINEGAILAARRNQKQIMMTDLQESIEKISLGPERRSRVISKKESEIVAYHEAGHALVAYMIPEADPVHKISIIARGGMGGFTLLLPEDDQTMMSEAEFKAHLTVKMGGRVAEEIIFGDITTGARGDLDSITHIARDMVTRYGMSKKLGPITFGDREELIFLGRQISEQRNYSEETAEQIDFEVRELVEEAHRRASQILTDHLDKLNLLAHTLLERETLDTHDFEALLRGDQEESLTDTSVADTSRQKTSSSQDTPPSVVPPSTAPLPA